MNEYTNLADDDNGERDLYFQDGTRRIHFILPYLELTNRGKIREYRENYIECLKEYGLETEADITRVSKHFASTFRV